MPRVLACIVPAIALAVFGHQLYRVHASHLSPWKGGGFGMFSAVDRPQARFLKIYLQEDGRMVPADPGRRLREESLALRTDPSLEKVAAMAEDVGRLTWVEAPQVASAGKPRALFAVPRKRRDEETAEREPISFDAVRIEVWRQVFDAASARIRAEEILGATVALDASD